MKKHMKKTMKKVVFTSNVILPAASSAVFQCSYTVSIIVALFIFHQHVILEHWHPGVWEVLADQVLADQRLADQRLADQRPLPYLHSWSMQNYLH